MKSIQEEVKIDKFLILIGLKFLLTVPQMRHLVNFIISCSKMNFDGKMTEVSNLLYGNRHRTSISRFFTESTWQEDSVLRVLQKYTIDKICSISEQIGKPVELIIDDTLSKKTKPRTKAVNIIDSCQYHRSHTENKSVYGHQIVVAILKCGKTRLPYHMSIYNKEIESKISIATSIITQLKGHPNIKYVLTDSWYSSESVIKAAVEADYTFIGALRTNRKIYPNSKKSGLQISQYISGLKKNSFSLVTVNRKKYHAIRYCGKIKGFEEVVVIITFPKGAFGNLNALKAFVCTDTNMPTYEILHTYSGRWPIEPFIRYCKRYLGLNGYQIRNNTGVKRYLISVMISYSYIATRNMKYSFSKNIKAAQNNIKHNTIQYIYNLGASNTPLSEVYTLLKAL